MKRLYGLFSLLFFLISPSHSQEEVYGTAEPFAAETIYFVLTDRFVDGTQGNNFPLQGGPNGTWQRPLSGCPEGTSDFVGYLGGDFKGIYDNASYIKDMGFTAVWITPIVDNPDQAFTGGAPVSCGAGVGTDGGKTGYHGYWGINFYKVDEHLESPGFSFREFTQKMKQDHGLKIVLDIVANHGSPSWSMTPVDQPKFGEIYDANDQLVADHQNKPPQELNPGSEPLHRFFNKQGNLAQLSDLNENNPAVLDYLTGAYLQWIGQGADAFRVDTIAWMPHAFWKQFADRIRAQHPGFFMFGENFNFDANTIAQHQRPENGAISVLDFPGKASIVSVFEKEDSNYRDIQGYLHLSNQGDCTYTNPYELATFYDNHDMARMNASEQGFIDAHNWLFTARGIPVVYYGSEMRFMHGRAEHFGNRNYYGPDNIAKARNNEIYKRLKKIVGIRKNSIALQKGLQENLLFDGHRAAFYRVYQKDGANQTALVLLNKGKTSANFSITKYLSAGVWKDASSGEQIRVAADSRVINTTVGPHDVKVLLFNEAGNDPEFRTRLQEGMQATRLCQLPRVVVSPEQLIAGEQVTVSYRGAGKDKQVALHWGINNWNGRGIPVSEDPMRFDSVEAAHKIQLQLPLEANQFDFVFHNLTDNTWDNNGGRDWHFQVVSKVPPSPSDIRAIAGDRTVTLSWTVVSSAKSYTLYYTDNGTIPTRESAKLTTTESQFTHTGLDNGKTYQYRLTASNDHGESELSATVSAVPGAAFKSRFPQGSVLRLSGEAFANWDPANAQYTLRLVGDYVWEGKVEVASALTQTPYKLTLNGNWTVNWGSGAAGAEAELARGGSNASVTLNPGTYTLTVSEGTSIDSPVKIRWIATGEPVLSVKPPAKDFGELPLDTPAAFDLRLENSGGGELVVDSVSVDVPWLTATLDSGQKAIKAAVNTSGLNVGQTYAGTIKITSNGGNPAVPITFTVSKPTSLVEVEFTCHNGQTYLGQSVYIVGSISQLGNWQPGKADPNRLGPTRYPSWTGKIKLPANLNVEWKCLKRDEKDPAKGIEWQLGPNNKLCTSASCPRSVSASF